MNRIRYDDFLLTTALTLARLHRPVWSWAHWRRMCRCGSELPCRARHRIPANRGHRPPEQVVTASREVPLLVQSAWYCLDQHRHSRCATCTETGFCPLVEAARERIRQWRRYRAALGLR